ncbi:MAG: FtsK/SpoIIIE domain-containing protein [Propionibacteriaceae bacterium]|nr:FtsK/SpoIIIE domain-containing protein [Propionibacteriaceae bacterium]
MRVAIEWDGVVHEQDLLTVAGTTTLGALVTHVTGASLPDEELVHVGDKVFRADTPLDEVRLLEAVTISRHPVPVPEPPSGWHLRLGGSLTAGQVVPLVTGRPSIVGRSPKADIPLESGSVSWGHASLEVSDDVVQVRDTESTNGTLVDGSLVEGEDPLEAPDGAVIVAGGNALTLSSGFQENLAPRPGTLPNVTPVGTVPFNRPPRPGEHPEPEELSVPKRKEVNIQSRFPIIMVLSPLLMAVVMVSVMGSWRYALIAGLSPLMAVGSYFDQRSRGKRERRNATEKFEQELDELRSRMRETSLEERARMQDLVPDVATVRLRATLPTTRLWERRHGTADFLALHVGLGNVPWSPPLADRSPSHRDEEVKQVIADAVIPAAPVVADLSKAGVVGIVGNRETALALARSLLTQAVTHCGPADLTVGVFVDPGREQEWEWAKWLPHTRMLHSPNGDRWLSHERARSDALLRTIRDSAQSFSTPTLLLLLDSDVLTEGRESTARQLLGQGREQRPSSSGPALLEISGIVIAPTLEQLPAMCTSIITVGDDAEWRISYPEHRVEIDEVIGSGVSPAVAREIAMSLARFEDPELFMPGAAIPRMTRLNPLLGVRRLTAEDILEFWGRSRDFSTPIGVGEKGTFELDLVRDGPHGLVGGTTGSGKSEFLRSLVSGLAARHDPTRLTFILIDFKGGAAFKALEQLPHTIGTISNLDTQLAERALLALEAEMRYRMEKFAAAGEGVDNLDAYWATNPSEPMPRLLLVVDEFAMLAKDYPDVLSALVSVAAVGRTLGVHMILATQRPAGVVNNDILANTNLRVALRVQSREDSSNVIGVPHASAIGREQRGRAYVKLGEEDITPVQTALVTGRVEEEEVIELELSEVVFGPPPPPPSHKPSKSKSDDTDMDELIDAIVAANAQRGYGRPRKVWPEALGERVQLAGFGEPTHEDMPVVGGVRDNHVWFAVSDDPSNQRQIPAGWDFERGNLICVGIPGSGTTTTLASIALGMCAHFAPHELDLVLFDVSNRDLEPLKALPHTIAYVGPGAAAREEQTRLLKYIREEFDRRSASSASHRRLLVLIDGMATLREEYQDYTGQPLLEGLYRAYADGVDVGIHIVVATTRAKTIPPAMDEVTTQKWLFKLADQYDYANSGLRREDAPLGGPGRAVLTETKLQTHVATPAGSLSEAVAQVTAQYSDALVKQSVVGRLPESITPEDLDATAVLTSEPWQLPVGLRASDLQPHFLELFEGEHAIIAGPARSGKSSVLLAIAEGARATSPDLKVLGLCTRRSPLVTASGLDQVADSPDGATALIAAIRLHSGPVLLLIDDAERFPDTEKTLGSLVENPPANLHIVASGRSDELRSLYNHWTKTMRKSRCGILLQPNVDFDGELLGAQLPRRAPVRVTTGRGYACSGGTVELIQAIQPRGQVG